MAKERVLISHEELKERIEDLGKRITQDYQGKDLVYIGLLRGDFILLVDSIRKIPLEIDIDFVRTASYGHGEESSGIMEILDRHRVDIRDKEVLLVVGFIDSDWTVSTVVDLLKKEKSTSIKTCLMSDKPSKREVDFTPDYMAFEIPDVFIIGCGLNYGGYCRNVPHTYAYDD